jgi:hypothetical protein
MTDPQGYCRLSRQSSVFPGVYRARFGVQGGAYRPRTAGAGRPATGSPPTRSTPAGLEYNSDAEEPPVSTVFAVPEADEELAVPCSPLLTRCS